MTFDRSTHEDLQAIEFSILWGIVFFLSATVVLNLTTVACGK